MMRLGLILFMVNSMAFAVEEPRADCAIDVDSAAWPQDPPIITDSNDKPVYPEGRWDQDNRVINVAEGSLLNLACSDRDFIEFPNKEFATARCIGGDAFAVNVDGADQGSFSFVELACSNQPNSHSEARGSCGPSNEGTIIEIGFSTADQLQVVMTLCFDRAEARGIYAFHQINSKIAARDTGNDRPSFRTDGYFDFDVNDAYTQATQAATIESLTGRSDYVGSGSLYLARGHMSPNSDFVYFSWQDATYYFTDVAPQWQGFNAGNWLDLENAVRDFVEQRGLALTVYTGTHGVMELENSSGDKVPIYLEPQQSRLPVPMYYWKVLHDVNARKGVAFIGVNNVHLAPNDINDFVLCPTLDSHPIMQDIASPNDIAKGVLYACEVGQIDNIFDEIPDLGSLGLLS